jgi:YebC/PmpR family DNA-binding regulatory protein
MSGHSHWHSIKGAKAITDAKKGKTFSKLARLISIAVKDKGSDPNINAKLRLAIEKAKEVNMPKENVERAIKKGSGEGEEGKLEEVSFEAFGPGNTALIIEGITDNKKRALGEVKQILSKNNGKLVGEGAVKWMFDKKGIISISKEQGAMTKEYLELTAIEAGADDIYWREDRMDIYAKPENLENVKKNLEIKGIKIESSSLGMVAKEEIAVGEKEKSDCQKLFEALDESDEVQEIYSNVKD